jgi:hypothetical protein
MEKKIYKVTVVFKLLDATHETLKNRIGEQENSESYVWAESEEDAIGQRMANILNTQTNFKIISISENKLTFSAERSISWTGPDISVNTVEISYSATPIQ